MKGWFFSKNVEVEIFVQLQNQLSLYANSFSCEYSLGAELLPPLIIFASVLIICYPETFLKL